MDKCIWYISKYVALPDDNSPGGRSFLLLRSLANFGISCELICSDSNSLVDMPDFDGDSLSTRIDGVSVHILKTFKYSVAKSFRRILSWLHFEWVLFKFPKRGLKKPDVVVISSLSLLTILNGFLIRHAYGCRLVFEVRDIWPLTLTEDGGYGKYNPLVIFLSFVEKIGYRYSDAIVGTMPNLAEHVRSVLGFSRPVYCIPMGVSEPALKQSSPLSAIVRDAYIPTGKFIVGYAGTIGITNALDTLFECAERMADNDKVVFLIVGRGDLRDVYISRYGHLRNLIFMPAVAKNEVQSVLAECDLLFLSAFGSRVFNFGQSLNKLVDYMVSGKPILASYSGYPSMINEAGCGSFVPAGDVERLKIEVERYSMLDKSVLSAMGKRGHDWIITNRSYERLASDYYHILFPK